MQANKKAPISKGDKILSTDDRSRLFAVELGETPQIDLHGLDPHSAMIELDQFLNHAYVQREEGVKIIHGIGSGTLKKSTHAFLKKHLLVSAFRDAEHRNQHGGMTVAIFHSRY